MKKTKWISALLLLAVLDVYKRQAYTAGLSDGILFFFCRLFYAGLWGSGALWTVVSLSGLFGMSHRAHQYRRDRHLRL